VRNTNNSSPINYETPTHPPLLPSPMIGQETGVLYQYETSGGIKWKTFGDGKVPSNFFK